MRITVGLLALADGTVSCPNCERELLSERDVKYVKTLGSSKPRKAFATCFYCGTSIEIAFEHEKG
jgi:uncharacterized Zn finger protein (UPF0148 family)